MKKIRKLTSLLLVLVMSLALAVPCFAAGPADDDGTIYLNVGDTYTDPETGYAYSFKPLGSANVQRSMRFNSYIVKNAPLSGASFHNNYSSDPDLGNVFAVEVNNQASKPVRATLNINSDNRDQRISAYGSGTLEIWNGSPYNGISGMAAVAVYANENPQLSGTISIYQYWMQ